MLLGPAKASIEFIARRMEADRRVLDSLLTSQPIILPDFTPCCVGNGEKRSLAIELGTQEYFHLTFPAFYPRILKSSKLQRSTVCTWTLHHHGRISRLGRLCR